MTANPATPIVGAALTTQTLAIHRGWIIEQQRDLEIQDFFRTETLDGDWRPVAAEIRRLPVLGIQDRQPGRPDQSCRDQALSAGP
jgi:hypothetical protein